MVGSCPRRRCRRCWRRWADSLNSLRTTTLSAVTILVAAFGLSGCSQAAEPVATPSSPTTTAAASNAVPLPDPAALTDVLATLSDPAIAGADKLPLVEGSTVAESGVLDNFAKALQDNQMLPLTFVANGLTWSGQDPGNVQATVTATPARPDGGTFTFPMLFKPTSTGWQLARETADLLLAFGNGQTAPAPSQLPPAPVPATRPR